MSLISALETPIHPGFRPMQMVVSRVLGIATVWFQKEVDFPHWHVLFQWPIVHLHSNRDVLFYLANGTQWIVAHTAPVLCGHAGHLMGTFCTSEHVAMLQRGMAGNGSLAHFISQLVYLLLQTTHVFSKRACAVHAHHSCRVIACIVGLSL